MSQSLRLWLIKQILTCRNTLWTNNVWTVLCRTLRSENIFVKKRQKIVLRPGNTELTRATVREREQQWDKNRSWWETLGCISTQQQRKLTSSTTHTHKARPSTKQTQSLGLYRCTVMNTLMCSTGQVSVTSIDEMKHCPGLSKQHGSAIMR